MNRHKWPLINWKTINWKAMVQPLLGVLLFLGLWQWGASQVQTSLGTLPGPLATASQLWSLGQEHVQEREKASAFFERQQLRNAERLAADPAAEALIAEGKLKASDFPDFASEQGYRGPQDGFIDGLIYDGRHPNAYLQQFAIGLKGDERVQ